MIFKKCCFILPLNIGCMIIAGLFIIFHVGELISHTDDLVFVRDTNLNKKWAPILVCPTLVFGTLSSILLIYGAKARKRGFVFLWVCIYSIILFLYILLAIIQLAKYTPVPIILSVQMVIIVGLIYSLMIVHSYYKFLKSVDDADDSI
ncbi:uncharacterized protein LOC108106409 [Drosophila eugracilis]|uniref:uncharacterized protein LOC108106409 n=1 Tax=Drosophila eugracilis TaxID=29029 RepID=UPI0007E71613|nr:uncharacterized protein LOC108106409 [Drosophila eugracilis]